jgi:hypothetical protein
VKEKPLAQMSYSGNCPEQPFTVFASTVASFPNSIIQNLWNDTLTNDSYPFPASAAGTYPLSLVSTASNGCRDTLIGTVVIDPLPQPQIVSSSPCIGESISVADAGTCSNCTHRFYTWQWNGQQISTQAAFDTMLHVTQAAEITVLLSDQRGCAGFDTLSITTETAPVANILSPEAIYGAPVSLEFSHTSAGSTALAQWQCQGQVQYGDRVSFIFNEPGKQNISLVTASSLGCRDTAVAEIDIPVAQSDLSIELLRFSQVADGYLRPVVQIKNLGNIPESNLILRLQPGASEQDEELLEGTLFPGDSAGVNASFSFLPRISSSNLCCVELEKTSLPGEQNLNNNKACRAIDLLLEGMDEPFPNPAGTEVNLRIYSGAEMPGQVQITDAAGRLIRKFDIDRKPGLQTVRIDLTSLSAGSYQIMLLPERQTRRLLIKGVKGP